MSPKKRILFLGPDDSPLLNWLREQQEEVIQTSEIITSELVLSRQVNFLVSYRYQHIIRSDILDFFPGRAINLHISFLPWNRGSDPNFWSFIENTPKGVTIHYLDRGVDTGDIIFQKQVVFDSSRETLRTTFEVLQRELQLLFKQNWGLIKAGQCPRHKQGAEVSSHKFKDKEPFLHLLIKGWDTPVSILEEYGEKNKMSRSPLKKCCVEIKMPKKDKNEQ